MLLALGTLTPPFRGVAAAAVAAVAAAVAAAAAAVAAVAAAVAAAAVIGDLLLSAASTG